MKHARVNFPHIGWAIIQTRFSGVGDILKFIEDDFEDCGETYAKYPQQVVTKPHDLSQWA